MSNERNQKLIESIGKKLGQEGIDYYVEHGELPAVKLSQEEEEFVRGGWWPSTKEVLDKIDYYKKLFFS